MAVFHKLGVHVLGVLIRRALFFMFFVVYSGAPDFWKLANIMVNKVLTTTVGIVLLGPDSVDDRNLA